MLILSIAAKETYCVISTVAAENSLAPETTLYENTYFWLPTFENSKDCSMISRDRKTHARHEFGCKQEDFVN